MGTTHQATAATRCASCGTELAPAALACPACRTLVHSGALKELVGVADARTQAGDLMAARDALARALSLLPSDTQQHAALRERSASLNERITRETTARRPSGLPANGAPQQSWWRRWLAGGTAAVLLALSKLKFLLLGLTKVTTFVSMFAFFGVYWSAFGWPLALGLVVSIYIHEMGHVAMLRRLGVDAGAPVFIPGIGALVRLKQHVDDPITDARIGLAGPVWGLGAGLCAFAIAAATGSRIWYAIAQLTGFINLFNLIPVWQLDGSRAFHALDRAGRWIVVAAAIAMYVLAHQPFLLVVAGVGAYRAFRPTEVRQHRPTLATFVVLVVSLALLAAIKVVP